jgi:hypothetical protein
MRALLFVIALATPALASAQPTQVVQRWFAALEQKNFPQAIALTEGAALERTEHMVGRLVAEAREHHADVEVKVKHLDVRDDGAGVLVRFDIDIVGKKWFFRRVARTLAGTARFTLADGRRIAAIDGRLE